MNWLALDIGGANLKLADGAGLAMSTPFPLWRSPDQLGEAIRSLLSDFVGSHALAVTMTGELADCYATKREGVANILKSVQRVASDRDVRVYGTNGRLIAPDEAIENPLLVAAANWHALARFAGRYAPDGDALLLDIGSTTTDVIGLINGQPVNKGTTDTERLATGELIYTGVARSPIAALSQSLSYRTQTCTVAQELFATTNDVYLILGDVPENADDCSTADGRPSTKKFARARMARMICTDVECFGDDDARTMAEEVMRTQIDQIQSGIDRVLGELSAAPRTVILSGSGEFLARRVLENRDLQVEVVSLRDELGADVSVCAAAHALAVLAKEEYR